MHQDHEPKYSPYDLLKRFIDLIPLHHRIYIWRSGLVVALLAAACVPTSFEQDAQEHQNNEVATPDAPDESTEQPIPDTTPTSNLILTPAATSTLPALTPEITTAITTPVPIYGEDSTEIVDTIPLYSPEHDFALALIQNGFIDGFSNITEILRTTDDTFVGFRLDREQDDIVTYPLTMEIESVENRSVAELTHQFSENQDRNYWPFFTTSSHLGDLGMQQGQDYEKLIFEIVDGKPMISAIDALGNKVASVVLTSSASGLQHGEWERIAGVDASDQNEFDDTELQTALNATQSTTLFADTSEALLFGDIQYTYTLSQVPFKIGEETLVASFDIKQEMIDFSHEFLSPLIELIRQNDIFFAVDTANPEAGIQSFHLTEVEDEYGSVNIEHQFVNTSDLPTSVLFPNYAVYTFGESQVEGVGNIFIFKTDNTIRVISVVPDRALTDANNLPAFQLIHRLQAMFVAMLINQNQRDVMAVNSSEKNLKQSDIAPEEAKELFFLLATPNTAPSDLSPEEVQEIYQSNDPVAFTITNQ